MTSLIAQGLFEQLMLWLEAKPAEPEPWQNAAPFGDTFLYVTAEELAQLGEQTAELHRRYAERMTRPETRPPEARLVSYLNIAYPYQGPGGRPDPERDTKPGHDE
jgi:hypothetical protein